MTGINVLVFIAYKMKYVNFFIKKFMQNINSFLGLDQGHCLVTYLSLHSRSSLFLNNFN